MTWIRAASLEDLKQGPRVVKDPPRQIAVFCVNAAIYAVDNRCPHEGYPLASGTIADDCILTCHWHNWKFRLSDGECVLGGDHVRTYPTRQQDGYVWIDNSDPSPAQIRQKTLRGLRAAFEDRDFGRTCREIARLRLHGIDPREAVLRALEWEHDRLEFGMTHATAATADWLLLAERFAAEIEPTVICLAEAVDHLAFDSLRHPRYPYPPPGESFRAEGFLRAIEAEDNGAAEAMVARGLADGLHWSDMEPAFAQAALAHYNSFGHSVIYVSKVGQLVRDLGAKAEPFLLMPLTREISFATREDLIPEFKDYTSTLAGLPKPGDTATGDRLSLEVPFPKTTSQALGWLERNLSTHTVADVYDALLEALSLNMLHYDTSYGVAYDRPVSQNIGWLDFTHGVTFSNAARTLCVRHPHLWGQALAQMACFLGRNHRFIEKGIDQGRWRVQDPSSFFTDIRQQLLDHGLRDPIFSAHLLKTSIAVEAELPHASESCQVALLSSLNRFLNSPLKAKHIRRLARQAIELVARDFE